MFERLLQQSFLSDGQPGACGEALDELHGPLWEEPHHEHVNQQVVQDDADEKVLLKAKALAVGGAQGVVPRNMTGGR